MACHECVQCNNTKDIETGIDQIINLFQHNSEKKNLFYKSVNKNKSCNNTNYSRKGSVIAVKEVNEWRLVSKGWQNSITRTRHNLRLQVGVTVGVTSSLTSSISRQLLERNSLLWKLDWIRRPQGEILHRPQLLRHH